jgi:Spy/CpxP family protein refolding chaperone
MTTYKTEFIGLVTALGLLSMLAFASSAFANDGNKGEFARPAMISERMADRLGLDETQRQQVQNIIDAAKPEFEALRDRVQAEIEAVLTEEQLVELEAAKQRRQEKGDRSRKR